MRLSWPPAPEGATRLGRGEVQVWSALLDGPPEWVKRLGGLLAEDEMARAARFHFPRHRRRYIVGRGLLRTLLGRILDRPPRDLRFAYTAHDKPYLPGSDLQFNLSHCEEVALFAFCWQTAVGVDVERVRDLQDSAEIAARFFSAAENQAFSRVTTEKQSHAFFNCWTRKEAYIKAIGEGLSCPLDCFDVSLLPGEPARLLRIHGSEEKAARWSLFALEPAAGYTGALALKGRGWRLSCYQVVV